MIDFDKHFEEYITKWLKANADKIDSDEIEERIPEIYESWANCKSQSLGGKTPNSYFEDMKTEDLISLLKQSGKGGNPCSLLLDRISQVPECGDYLKEIVKGEYSKELKMLAINLLTELGASHPLEVYVNWITGSEDKDLKELGVEILIDNAEKVAVKLYEIADFADNAALTLIAEILINAPKDERTYNILVKLFSLGDNIPLYAGYIGKYGDERAAAMLYRAIDTCNYLEYIELKNAIERMGGVVEVERDFSDDVYYKAIKNVR